MLPRHQTVAGLRFGTPECAEAQLPVSEGVISNETRESLASAHPGRFLLIQDCPLHRTFDTLDGTLAAGFSKFGSKPLLVPRAGEDPIERSAPALMIGMHLVAAS